MIFSVLRSSTSRLRTFLITVTLLAAIQPAHAYFYSGGDWGGRDLLLLNGDTLSGNFSNVGQFYIPSGASISGSTDNLVVHANRFLIDGSLTGIAVPGYKVELTSLTDLILNGSITSWQSISLSAQQVFLNTGSLIAVIDVPAQPPLTGGTISLVPTPVPAAAWLLGSGLLGLVGIRRRRG